MKNPILNQIQEQSRFEKIDYADSCLLRGCFDCTSSEWSKSTVAQKVEALEVLMNRDKVLTSTLVSKMLHYCNEEANKGIEQKDVILSLGIILEYLIKGKKMDKIIFTMDKVYTFGSKDAEHRFLVRNHFLNENPAFDGLVKTEEFVVSIDIEYEKASFDIDNVPKVIIDSFSGSQIERDLNDLKHFREEPSKLSDTKQKEYAIISKMQNLNSDEKYRSLGVYAEDTVNFVSKLSCSATQANTTKIRVTIQ